MTDNIKTLQKITDLAKRLEEQKKELDMKVSKPGEQAWIDTYRNEKWFEEAMHNLLDNVHHMYKERAKFIGRFIADIKRRNPKK